VNLVEVQCISTYCTCYLYCTVRNKILRYCVLFDHQFKYSVFYYSTVLWSKSESSHCTRQAMTAYYLLCIGYIDVTVFFLQYPRHFYLNKSDCFMLRLAPKKAFNSDIIIDTKETIPYTVIEYCRKESPEESLTHFFLLHHHQKSIEKSSRIG
jgi:hypothetical protein